jgi:hypothetical protein
VGALGGTRVGCAIEVPRHRSQRPGAWHRKEMAFDAIPV